MIPDNWKTYSLKELCLNITDGSHYSPKDHPQGGKIIATVKDMDEYGFDLKNCKRISEEDYQNIAKNGCKPEAGDVLFSKDGTIGIVQYFKGDIDLVLLSSIAILKPNCKKVDGRFLSFYLRNPFTNKFIKDNFKSGSALPRIVLKDLKKLNLTVPATISEQSRIASILSSLDDKIELNLQMNKTLESIAQAIFKEWFVDFRFPGSEKELMVGMPNGWYEVNLNDIVELLIDHRGKTPIKLGSEWVSQGIPAISAKNVKDGMLVSLDDVGYVDEELFEKWMKEKLSTLDILLTSEAPLGEVAILMSKTNFCLSQRLFAIRTNDKCTATYLYFFLRSRIGKANVQKRATGSTVTGIRQSELRKVEILLPDQKTQYLFHQIVLPLLAKIDENNNEIKILIHLRNTLLPRLMTGKIRVA